MRGGHTDLWTYNNDGYLRIHKRARKALFTPDANTCPTCPVPLDNLENFRRTILHRDDNNDEDLTEEYKSLNKHQQRRVLKGMAWTGETWFKPKPGATASTQPRPPIPDMPKPAPAMKASTPFKPTHRRLEKTPPTTTSLPHPSNDPITTDYWIKEGRYWKRVHVQPRTNMHTPQQMPDGPDTSRLTSWRQTFVKPTHSNREYCINDEWQHGQDKALDTPWTGSTNFEEQAEYKERLDTDNEDPQAAKPARGVTAPKQPTPRERAEHNLTHLPYRTWCPTCVASKGKADSHTTAKHTSKVPVIQVDFTYMKASAEKTATPILTAIDVEQA